MLPAVLFAGPAPADTVAARESVNNSYDSAMKSLDDLFKDLKEDNARNERTLAAADLVIFTGLAIWGWKSTDRHNSGFIRFTATMFTIRAIVDVFRIAQ